MKKLLYGLALLFALSSTTNINAQRIKYYYYSHSNVYYNPDSGDYWYYDNPTTSWVTVRSLPPTMVVTDDDRNIIYYNGTTPWKHNDMDRKKYKVKKNGVIKEKD